MVCIGSEWGTKQGGNNGPTATPISNAGGVMFPLTVYEAVYSYVQRRGKIRRLSS